MLRFGALLILFVSAAAPLPPRIVLWSWYAEDDLRFLKENRDIGVAWLALTLEFEGGDRVIPSPRESPLRLAPETWQMAVVRCEFDTGRPPKFSPHQRDLTARMIAEIVKLTGVRAVQIDFDAPLSARPFFANPTSATGSSAFSRATERCWRTASRDGRRRSRRRGCSRRSGM